MNDSTSSAQLKDEIASLTKSVAQLETEISQTPEPLRRSETRTINLDRFHKIQNLFSTWNEDTDILKESVPAAMHHSPSTSPIIFAKRVVKKVKEDEDEEEMFRMSEDGDSVVIQSQESFLTTSKTAITSSEKVAYRVLAVLQSYLHNLQNGMLVNSWDKKGRVATALRDLIEPELDENDKALDEDEGSESVDLRKMTDEEGMLSEVARYRNTILRTGEGVAEAVLKTAKEILDFDGQQDC